MEQYKEFQDLFEEAFDRLMEESKEPFNGNVLEKTIFLENEINTLKVKYEPGVKIPNINVMNKSAYSLNSQKQEITLWIIK